MRKFIFIMLTSILIAFTACQKEDLVEKKTVTTLKTKPVEVLHGMLVFDSEESFDAKLKEIQNLGNEERKTWEEDLGFKSFDRSISEILDEQAAYEKQFAYHTQEEMENLIEGGEIDEYSPIIKEYVNKGIIEVAINENKERYFNINSPMYSSVVNIDGFVAVGNEILQYTKDKFKLIKSLDYSKIEELKSIKDNVNDETFFVTAIKRKEKVAIGQEFEYSAESFTTDRKKIVATETYQFYDRYHNGIFYEANYTVRFVNMRKGMFFWNNQVAQTWVWGNFEIEAKGMPNGKENLNFSYPDMNVAYTTITVLKRKFFKLDYLYSPHGGPQIFSSTWSFVRTGGSHGLGVRLINHIRYERF
ncbi:MAG: hypothetical protein P1P88_13390 [Bacteroidales bacterium]|nr:hypothetical protein [Bacteroidales bacterium]